MKFKRTPRIKAIQAKDAKDFESQFNEFIEQNGDVKDYKADVSDGQFFAIIHYVEETYIAESIAEEYELRGESFRCRDCPECVPPMKGNTKRCDCRYAELGYTRLESPACEWFYRQLSQGKLKPREVPLR